MTTETQTNPQEITSSLSVDRTKDGPGLWLDPKIMAKTHLTLAQRAVLGNLVFRVGVNGKCWPTTETIARDLGISRPTVVRAIKKLKAAHEIAVESAHGGVRQANLYAIMDPNLAHQNDTRESSQAKSGASKRSKAGASKRCARSQSGASKRSTEENKRINNTKQQAVVGGKARAGESKRGTYPKRERVIDETILPRLKQSLPQIAGQVSFDMLFEVLGNWPSEQIIAAIGRCDGQTEKWGGVMNHLKVLPQRSLAQKNRQAEIIRQLAHDPLAASEVTVEPPPLPDDEPVAALAARCVKTPDYGQLAVN